MIEIKIDNDRLSPTQDEFEKITIENNDVTDLASEVSKIVFRAMVYAYLKFEGIGCEEFRRTFLQLFDVKTQTFADKLIDIEKNGDAMHYMDYLKRMVNYKGGD